MASNPQARKKTKADHKKANISFGTLQKHLKESQPKVDWHKKHLQKKKDNMNG